MTNSSLIVHLLLLITIHSLISLLQTRLSQVYTWLEFDVVCWASRATEGK